MLAASSLPRHSLPLVLIELDDGCVIHCHIDHIRVHPPSTTVPISTHPSHDDWPDDTIPHNSENPSAPSHSELR